MTPESTTLLAPLRKTRRVQAFFVGEYKARIVRWRWRNSRRTVETYSQRCEAPMRERIVCFVSSPIASFILPPMPVIHDKA